MPIAQHLSPKNLDEEEPLRPTKHEHLFQGSTPVIHGPIDAGIPWFSAAPAFERLAGDDLVVMIARTDNEDGKNRHLRDEREHEWTFRQPNDPIKKADFAIGYITDHPIALDRDDLPVAQSVEQFKGQLHPGGVVSDSNRAAARALE